MPTWTVYLIECADTSLYCGVTTDLDRRLAQHDGTIPGGAKYTRGRGPVRLIAGVACPDQSSALRLEIAVKNAKRPKKLETLLAGHPADSV